MLDFREILSHCDLYNLGFGGQPWTYDNKQAGESNVKVRLDRFVATLGWSSWFPDASLQHIVSSRSDHCPILLHMAHEDELTPPQCISQYEIMWKREETLPEETKDSWASVAL
jgi:hypothetical protein